MKDKLQNVLLSISSKVETNKYLGSIKEAFTMFVRSAQSDEFCHDVQSDHERRGANPNHYGSALHNRGNTDLRPRTALWCEL